jgi:aminoglycoside phosphotransferase (APT) family kinase protein
MDEDVVYILGEYWPNQEWEIHRPESGWRKECYIASNGTDRYFLKFDVPIETLRRLGEIQVAPRVLRAGRQKGLDFVIQEFVSGVHPESKEWMRRHVDELVSIIKIYHEDAQLCGQLAELFPTDFRVHLRQDLEWLSKRFSSCDTGYLRTETVRAGFERLIDASSDLEIGALAPIHNDPSPTNILLTDGKFLFLDWDEITLSDPMRDIGLLLWWNFPPDQWRLFFDKYGTELTPGCVAKIYWFAARASFDIAVWHAEHGLDGKRFVDDFLAAGRQGRNPKGY